MKRSTWGSRGIVGAWAAALALSGCKDEQPEVAKDPAPLPSPSASASGGAVVEAPKPKETPVLGVELAPGDDTVDAVYPVDGAVLVAAGTRVGRVTEAGVEWLGAIQAERPAFGPNAIDWVGGSYPDGVDVTYSNLNGRAPSPTYQPLTGKGDSSIFSPGGGMGWIAGVARIGETTLVSGYSNTDGYLIVHARGPKLERKSQTQKEAGCPDKPRGEYEFLPRPPAVPPYVFGATADGTLFALGTLCDDQGPAAEVWDPKTGKSKIHKLGEWMKDIGFLTKLLPDPGDVMWLAGDEGGPIVQYEAGTLKALEVPGEKVVDVFVSTDRVLHASDGTTIRRLEKGAWVDVARLAWFTKLGSITAHEGTFWTTLGSGLAVLRPTAPVAYHEECKTPFVYLYDVSPLSEPTYTFPTTRKALATFKDVDRLGLVDFLEGNRRLGITVPSKEIGEAVIAHVRANMKDEDPKLLCYVPTKKRDIPIGPAAR